MATFDAWRVPHRVAPNGPLYFHQANLPRLPVPEIEETLMRYLKSVRPLANDQEFQNTAKIVQDFLISGQADELHSRLVKHAEKKNKYSSWLIDWWNDWAYFGYRDSVVINVSYYYQFKDLPAFKNCDQTKRASLLISSTLKYRDMLINEQLDPEPSNLGPALCSSMYAYLFNACRIPVKPLDHTVTFSYENSHIIVAFKNQFFYFDVIITDKNGVRRHLTVEEIDSQLKKITSTKVLPEDQNNSVGILTSENRDVWADGYKLLVDAGNEASLRIIESAILILSLDSETPNSLNDVARTMWHGSGTNRWYDKSITYVVTANGQCGFLGEHSMMDGTITLRMVDWCLNQIAKNKVDSGSAQLAANLPTPTHIPFKLNDKIKTAIASAKKSFESLISTHELSILQFKHFGKEGLKKMRVHPDAFTQLAIQLAYFKLKGHFVGTYESCQTRSFLHGRTEVIRSCTVEASRFVHTMLDKSKSHKEKHQSMLLAAQAHLNYARCASNGRGVDRHLLGMRLLLKDGEKFAIFDDPIFSRSSRWRLSTSTLRSEYFDAWGFGEVVPDGFGVGYMVNNNQINFSLTSLHLGTKKFAELLEESMLEMAAVCETRPTPRL
eukprot:c21015_g3_i2.p1 GENE.c21015_g3_i2~~c21015_g3_i2.p1  ORF type:complete len:610 (-),score=239.96 c21015_g3_i2:195-2024(-)